MSPRSILAALVANSAAFLMKPHFPRFLWLMALCLCTAPASAGPIFTYDFQISSWKINSNPSLYGTGADLFLSFSNDNSTNENQSYTFADIVGASLTTIGGTFEIPGTPPPSIIYSGDSSTVFVTTNATGVVTNDLIPAGQSLIITAASGDQSFQVLVWPIESDFYDWGGPNPFPPVQSTFGAVTSVTFVPEPSSIGMLGGGLLMLSCFAVGVRKGVRSAERGQEP